ncbi:Hypothetical predicted protein [Octopus vulgaris]|uniref:Uncharacterized protein n=1 Tax=Octopus vulgaris TaxID=6645 RepID=A0AA36B0K5_OCTVU|nr:Hypothetical predicted protein [Octopus vulgaris]
MGGFEELNDFTGIVLTGTAVKNFCKKQQPGKNSVNYAIIESSDLNVTRSPLLAQNVLPGDREIDSACKHMLL